MEPTTPRKLSAIPQHTDIGGKMFRQKVWTAINWKCNGRLCGKLNYWVTVVAVGTHYSHTSGRCRYSSEHSTHRLFDFKPSLAALWWFRYSTVGVLRGTHTIAYILTPKVHIYSKIYSVKLTLDLDPQDTGTPRDVETFTMVIEKATVTFPNVIS